jgi:hypothetical protein
MRWCVMAVCVCIVVGADGCDPTTTTVAPDPGQLAFQKDSTCTDTTNTELFIDDVSQGQFTMRPGSLEGFNKNAGTHLAQAIERAGKKRDFGVQAITVPALSQGLYLMRCAYIPPPDTSASPPIRPGG